MPKGDKLTTSEYPSESSVPIDAHIKPPRNFPPMSKSERLMRRQEADKPSSSLYRGKGETGRADPDTRYSASTPMSPKAILDEGMLERARGVY